MTRRILILVATILGFTVGLGAQNSQGKTDDLGRIALAAIVPEQAEGIPQSARQQLVNKMEQIA
ncbi:MAG TPA: hypothetical protein PKN78_01495, partial [Tenuifilaceae bacterium]|nr:hypothetical protein [Tenuifilaceae bacterium]